MDIQENSILQKIINMGSSKRVKCVGKDVFQTYIFYFSTRKINDNLRVRFLFSANHVECKNVYGTFLVSPENKIITVELHDNTPSSTSDLFKIMDCFSSLEHISIHAEKC
jgi:hypothetical protein